MEKTQINEIDLLRFLAALMVVLFHYAFRGHAADGLSSMPYPLLAPYARYGYLGVELFFLISGFVILMTASSGNLLSFARSRILRLYPAFWVSCTLTFTVTLLIGAPRFTASMYQYLVNMTMISELMGVPAIDGAYWSLMVEIKFYCLVAVILLLRQIHQAQYWLLAWLLVTIALEIHPIGPLNYLLITEYATYFIAGATLWLTRNQGLSPLRAGILLACWALALYQSSNHVPTLQNHFHTGISLAVANSIITVFFIMMLLIALDRTGAIGRQRWALAGALSYPLYLLHQNIGYMVFNLAYPSMSPHGLLWGTLLGMLMLAYAIHTLVEQRFTASTAHKQRPSRHQPAEQNETPAPGHAGAANG